MSEQLLIEKETLVDIADAIRAKTNSTEGILVENLAQEISEISSYETDTTLTKEGWAADAKAVGDRINEDSLHIAELQENLTATSSEIQETLKDISFLASTQEDLIEQLELISSTTSQNSSTLDNFIVTENQNMEIGHIDNNYKLQINEDGIQVLYKSGAEPIANFYKNNLTTPNVIINSSLKFGDYIIKYNSANDLLFI